MARYALVNAADEIVAEKDESRIDLDAGTKTGWRWLVIENVTVDNSTGPDTKTSAAVEAILADKVTRTRTITDKTQAELDAEKAAQADGIIDGDTGKMLLSLYRTMYAIAKLSVPTLTPAQFKTQVDNATAATDIPAAGFKTWVEEQI